MEPWKQALNQGNTEKAVTILKKHADIGNWNNIYQIGVLLKLDDLVYVDIPIITT